MTTRRARRLLMEVIQPGLDGWMDGAVSVLAPIFAALAFGKPESALLAGLAVSIGGGISMAAAEAQSDTGAITGRGSPWIRGAANGLGAFFGGLVPTLAVLLYQPQRSVAVAMALQLGVIGAVRARYLELPVVRSVVQSLLVGSAVAVVGVMIGSS
jgi:VIT1/CCC1 family predicted Fe2+/Mn2+ transporter